MMRLASGIPGLDRVLCGGLHEGSSTVLVGPPSTGKTWFASQFLASASSRPSGAMYVHLSREQKERTAARLPEPLSRLVSAGHAVLRRERFNRAVAPWLATALDELSPERVVLELAFDIEELSARELGWVAEAERVLGERGITSLVTARGRNPQVELLEQLARLAPAADVLLALELRSTEFGIERQLLTVSVKGAAVPSRYHQLELGEAGLSLAAAAEADNAPSEEVEALPLYVGAPPYLQGELKRLYGQRLRRHLAAGGTPGLKSLHGRPFFSQVVSELYAPHTDFAAVLVSEPGMVRHLAAKGLLMELDEVFPEHNELFIEKALRRSTFFGHLYGAPQHVSVRVLFYRKDLLRKHGLRPPRSWDELESHATYVLRAERDPELAGLLFEYRSAVRFGLLLDHVWSSGEDLYGDGGNYTFNLERASEAIARLRRLVGSKLSPLLMTPSEHWDCYQRFFAGKALFLHHWSDGLRLVFERGAEARERFGWCVLPGRDGARPSQALAAGVSYVVPKNTRQPELAKRVIRRLLDPEFLARMEPEFGWPFPASARVYDDERVLAAHPYYAEGHELLARSRLLEEARYIEGDPFEWSRVAAEAMGLAFPALRSDAKEPDEIAALLQQGFARLLPKPSYAGLSARAVALIDRDLAQPLSGAVLAERLGVSRPHLAATFRRDTGRTLHDYVTERRMLRAKELLQHSELSIGEVASRLGFKTIFHFSRVFKEQLGVSPRRYRNQQ